MLGCLEQNRTSLFARTITHFHIGFNCFSHEAKPQWDLSVNSHVVSEASQKMGIWGRVPKT